MERRESKSTQLLPTDSARCALNGGRGEPDIIPRWKNRYYQTIKRDNAGKRAETLEVTVAEQLEKVEVEPEQSNEQQQGQTPMSVAETAEALRFFS